MSSFEFQSQEHRDLFDIIDRLRSQGISKYVSLPQLVVCGDQSSGKSSVLEAISGMTFPTKDNLCTRFATEVILRRTPGTDVSCKVSIIPDSDRPASEKTRLQEFSPVVDLETLNLGNVVEAAKQEMGLSDAKRFSNDILSVELCGPTQPHLTMVDLPGLFKAGNKDQSSDDADTVRIMVKKWTKEDRSIILAVVSAKNDFANQEVTELTRAIDPTGFRTMGIITKPDTLHSGSDSERFYVNLAQNKDVKFRLGWHVLRNRDYPERDIPPAERDELERVFFASGAWAALDRGLVGIATLAPKLSNILKDQIILQLGSLQLDVEQTVQHCRADLERLGPARSTAGQQRRYLGRVSQEFTRLMDASANGTFSDPFFGDPLTATGFQKRLRAVVRQRLDEFRDEIQTHGQSKRIVDGNKEELDGFSGDTITRTEYIETVKVLMQRSRGRELPGLYDPLIIGQLFSKQSQPWERIALDCKDRVLQATFETINQALEHVTAPETTYVILQRINDGMETLKGDLDAAINRLLRPHQSGHPITCNTELLKAVRASLSQHRCSRFERLLLPILGADSKSDSIRNTSRGPYMTIMELAEELDERLEVSMGSDASSSAIDYMEAYYEVSKRA